MKKVLALALVLTFAIGTAPLFAAEKTYNPAQMLDNKIDEGVASDRYIAKAPSQLLRGTHNVVFGWSDIVSDLFQPPIGIGTALSPLTGPVTAIARTGSGLVDILTFWIPGFHGWAP